MPNASGERGYFARRSDPTGGQDGKASYGDKTQEFNLKGFFWCCLPVV
jgi:hypothetical protein